MIRKPRFSTIQNGLALIVLLVATSAQAQQNFNIGDVGKYTIGLQLNLAEQPELGVVFNLRPTPTFVPTDLNAYASYYTSLSDFGRDFEFAVGGSGLPIWSGTAGGSGFGLGTGVQLEFNRENRTDFSRSSVGIRPFISPGIYGQNFGGSFDVAFRWDLASRYNYEDPEEEDGWEGGGAEDLEIGPIGTITLGNNYNFALGFRQQIYFGEHEPEPATGGIPIGFQVGTHYSF